MPSKGYTKLIMNIHINNNHKVVPKAGAQLQATSGVTGGGYWTALGYEG